jgi:hypothetical protein
VMSFLWLLIVSAMSVLKCLTLLLNSDLLSSSHYPHSSCALIKGCIKWLILFCIQLAPNSVISPHKTCASFSPSPTGPSHVFKNYIHLVSILS